MKSNNKDDDEVLCKISKMVDYGDQLKENNQ